MQYLQYCPPGRALLILISSTLYLPLSLYAQLSAREDATLLELGLHGVAAHSKSDSMFVALAAGKLFSRKQETKKKKRDTEYL